MLNSVVHIKFNFLTGQRGLHEYCSIKINQSNQICHPLMSYCIYLKKQVNDTTHEICCPYFTLWINIADSSRRNIAVKGEINISNVDFLLDIFNFPLIAQIFCVTFPSIFYREINKLLIQYHERKYFKYTQRNAII